MPTTDPTGDLPDTDPSAEWLAFCAGLAAATGIPSAEAERAMNQVHLAYDGPQAQAYQVPGTNLVLVTADGVSGAVIFDGDGEVLDGAYLDTRCLAAARALLGEALLRSVQLDLAAAR